MDTCLIDGDVVVYICGFAAQQTWYTCEVDQSEHATRKLALAHLESIGELDEDGEITTTVVAEPLSHALRLVKNMLLRAHEASGAATSRVFLSGPTNYRTALATIRPYKGNRPSNKPVHYEKIREYLISTHHAEVRTEVRSDRLQCTLQRVRFSRLSEKLCDCCREHQDARRKKLAELHRTY